MGVFKRILICFYYPLALFIAIAAFIGLMPYEIVKWVITGNSYEFGDFSETVLQAIFLNKR